MLTSAIVIAVLLIIAALASAEKLPGRALSERAPAGQEGQLRNPAGSRAAVAVLARSESAGPPRKAIAPPCEIQCLEAKNAALQRLAVKRLKGWDKANRRAANLRRSLLHQGSVTEALNLACATYGHCSELWRKARCESHLFPYAHNPSGASGLFQFLPSTFRSTPYAGLSIWSPYANAMAAGWMHVHGRSGEWVCR